MKQAVERRLRNCSALMLALSMLLVFCVGLVCPYRLYSGDSYEHHEQSGSSHPVSSHDSPLFLFRAGHVDIPDY